MVGGTRGGGSSASRLRLREEDEDVFVPSSSSFSGSNGVFEHHHMNEQIMHVVEGSFEFTLDGNTKVYGPGDIVVIPSHTPHSGKALTPCKLMDIFSPAREEYK